MIRKPLSNIFLRKLWVVFELLKGTICGNIDCIIELGAIEILLGMIILVDKMGKDFGMLVLGD